MTRHSSTLTHSHTDNLSRADILKSVAVDKMYAFQTGTRAVPVAGVSEEFTVTGRFMAHAWGCSVQLWARNKHGKTQAAAESTVSISDQEGSYIAARIKQFRTGELLWTNTAEPVSHRKIEPALDTFLAAGHDVAYQLRAEYEFSPSDIEQVWILSSPGQDFTPMRFDGLRAAATYIDAHLAGARK
jgi:hypothetical protein